MQSSSQGAQAADAQLAANAKQNQAFTNNARLKLFGTPDGKGGFSGGTMSQFLDPNSLNVSSPTGAYKTQYNQEVGQIAQNGQNARGALARNLASRGFSAPTGFAADQTRKALLDQNSQQGQAFTANTMQSYQDALSNFWRASGALNGEGDTALSASISGDQAAANNYANLYGTASTPKPSVMGDLIGGGLQAGGSIGAAAVKGKGSPASTACWIAEALYGVDDWRTHSIRAWLLNEYSKTFIGSVVYSAYRKFGQRVAAAVKRSRVLRSFFRPIFDAALRKSISWRQQQLA